MSKTVDERVVSMQFDNTNFEANARESMSTLDKLKQKLNLKGASKGLDEVRAASKKVNFSEIENAAYRSGFHVQDVWLKTASVLEYQVADKIISAGKRMLSSITTAPVGDGFREYEMTLNAVQTTMAGTGKTAKEVEAELKKLDEYADKTIYSTADMLNNLPKFTNAGVDLEVATKAMIGIANATAHAGGDAAKASIAFYNLGQSMGTGYLTRMDYNSINNAGIATMEWKNQMVEAAIAQGTLTKVGEDAYRAGNKTLTLQQLFIDGLQEQWATAGVLTKVFGDYGDETTDIGKKAYESATKIKTFSMMMDSLKASAGTGWKDTWQIVFGGLDDATEFWSDIYAVISGVIDKTNKWRNDLLESSLGRGFSALSEKLNDVLKPATAAVDAISGTASALCDLGEMANQVWRGDWDNGVARYEKLTEAGYNYFAIQNKVNEVGGYSFRYTQEQIDAQDELLRSQGKVVAATEDQGKATTELTEDNKELLKSLVKMDEAQLKSLGYNESQISALKELAATAEKLGIPVDEFIDKMDKINGRWLLINSFKNIFNGLKSMFGDMKAGWQAIFPAKTIEERSEKLFGIISAIHKFTANFRTSLENNSDQIQRTFKGIAAAIDIIRLVVGGPLKIAFKILKEILGMFGLNIWDVTAVVGDVIVAFRDWIKNTLKLTKVFDKILPPIKNVISAIRDWIAGIKDAENVPQYIANGIGTAIGKVFKFIGNSIKSLGEFVFGGFKNTAGFMTDGLLAGLFNGIKVVAETIWNFGKTIIETICEVLGIHSPSTEMAEVGGFTIEGFICGVRDALSGVWKVLGEIGSGIVNFLKDLSLEKIFALTAVAAITSFAITLGKGIKSVFNLVDGLGDLTSSAADFVKTFDKTLNRLGKAVSNSLNALAFKQLAISIAILVGSIVVLTLLDPKKMWSAVGVIAALIALMAGLFVVVNKFGSGANALKDKKKAVDFGKMAAGILAIGAAMFIIVLAAKMIAKMDTAALVKAGVGLVVIGGVMVGIMAATKLMAGAKSDNNADKNIKAIGKTLKSIAVAILILVIAAKLIASMDWSEMAKAGVGLVVLAGIMVGLMAATQLIAKTSASGHGKDAKKIGTDIEHIGKTLKTIAVAMLILVIAAKLIASMDWSEMAKAGVGLGFLAGIMVGLMAATQLLAKTTEKRSGVVSEKTGADIEQIGKTLMKIASAILVMVIAAKLIASMDWAEMAKAGVGLVALSGIMVGLTAATRLAGGNDLKGVAVTILAMALAIGVMATAALILSFVETGALFKAVTAIGILSGAVAIMVKSTKDSKDCHKNLIIMIAAIAVMAAAVAILSFIDLDKLAVATAALGLLMGAFAYMIKSTEKMKTSLKSMAVLGIMVGVIVILTGVVYLLSRLDAGKALPAAIALGVLMVALSTATVKIAAIGKRTKLGSLVKGLVVLAGVIVATYAVVGALALMSNVDNAVKNAIVLAALMAALSVATGAIAALGKGVKLGSLTKGLVVLAGVIVATYAVIGALALMSNVDNAVKNAIVLAALMAALSVATVVIAAAGAIVAATGGMALLGLVALAGVIAALYGIVGAIAIMDGMTQAERNTKVLIRLMKALTKMFVVTAVLGPLAIIGVAAMTALSGMIAVMAVVATALGALIDTFPSLETFVDKGIVLLEKLAEGLGSMIGKFVTALVGEIMDFLPTMADQLSLFMDKIQPFLAGAREVDDAVLDGTGRLALMILEMSGAGFVAGILDLLSFGTSLPQLGKDLGDFMTNAMPFVEGACKIDAAAMQGINTLANVLLKLTANNLLDTIVSWFSGESSLKKFANEMPLLGKGIHDFAANCGSIDTAAVASAATSVETLANAAKKVSNIGGIFASFFGTDTLGDFANNMASLGAGLNGFALAMTDITDEDMAAKVKIAADAVQSLGKAAEAIPGTGGLLQSILGETDLGKFSEDMAKLGDGISGFATNLDENFDDAATQKVTFAADAVKSLAQAAEAIPETGSWLKKWIWGETDLAGFADSLPKLGLAINSFCGALGSFMITSDKAKAAVEVAAGLISSFAGLDPLDASEAYDLTGYLPYMADRIKEFATKIVAENMKITLALNTIRNISKLFNGKDAAALSIDGISSFTNALGDLAKNGVKAFTGAFGTETTVSDVEQAALSFVESFLSTLDSEAVKTIRDAKFNAFASACATVLKSEDNLSLFNGAGSYVVEGFAAGITANTFKAEAAAAAMADAAYDAAKEALDVNSPSKVFRKLGKSVPEGFAVGIGMLGGVVKDAALGMTNTAINGTKSAIARISDAVNSDIDSQPTIRPVLDLSNVAAGASSINGMFKTPRLAMSTAGEISTMMNVRQNGGADVFSAIKELGSKIGTAGNSYTINGITVSEGTEAADAIRTLVRAITIDGRS